MRILFFSHYFLPEGNAPAARTYENCKRWVRQGHEVTVVTGAPNAPAGIVYDGYRNRVRHEETIDGIRVVRVWTYIAANKGTLLRIFNYVTYCISASFFAMFLPKPQVVISTSPQFFCGWAGVIVSRLKRVPLILEIRDLWPESITAVGAMKQGLLLRVLEWLEAKMYAAAQVIVTVGAGYRDRLLRKGVEAERVEIVMNGVDRELFVPREPDESLIQRWALADRFVCTYVGTIGMACGLDVVLRAAKILRDDGRDDIVFLMVGDGASRRQLEDDARRLELSQVIFTGRLAKSLMPAVLSIADACLVHLRKTDLFTTVMPSKVFEAAGMQRPIICGVAGFATDLVRSAGAGVSIEPENERELAEALRRLADDPELGRSLGRAGYEYVVRYHDRDRLADDYLEIIRRAVAPL